MLSLSRLVGWRFSPVRDAGGRGATRTRRGWSPQQLFGWRRQVREAQAVICKDNEVRFVPAIVDAAPPGGSEHLRRKARRQHRDEPLVGTIEVAIDGVTVRIGAGAPADTIAAVLRALKAGT
jgi:transposase